MEHDDLEGRLRTFGRHPVNPEVRGRHLTAIAEVRSRRPGWRFGWRSVAAAAVAGFVVGSTGLAVAGELPDPAQDVAHEVLAKVGVDVPRSTEGCPEGGTYRNHGAYVSEVEAAGGDVEAASRSSCGKPAHAGKSGADKPGKGRSGSGRPATGEPRADTDGDPCTGPPPWAGAHLSADQKATLQAEHAAQCPDDVEEPESETDVEPEETTTTTG
jgi:hypothetical protein